MNNSHNAPQRRLASRSKRIIALVALLTMTTLVADDHSPAVSAASEFVVDNLDDKGSGSLRQALLDLGTTGSSDANTIRFASTLAGRLRIVTDLPVISKPLTIVGPGRDAVAINGFGRRHFSANHSTPMPLHISGLTLTGGEAQSGGSIHVSNTTLTLQDVSIRNNRATAGNGGAVAALGESRIEVIDSDISDNAAAVGAGGAIWSGAGIVITRSSLERNTATSGGAIYSTDSDITITDSDLIGNAAAITGGAVFISEGTLSATRSTFIDNTGRDGGAVYGHMAPIDTELSLFVGNTATADGGSMYTTGTSPITVMQGVIDRNEANGSGGAIDASHATGTVDISESVLTSNEADFASVAYVKDLAVEDSRVTGNRSDESAIYVEGSPISRGSMGLDRTTIDDNTGGALLMVHTDAQISHSTLSGNIGPRAGAVELTGSTLDIDRSTFSGNTGQIVDGIYSPPPPDPVQVLSSDVTTLATTFDGDGVDMGSPGSFTMRQTALDGPLRLASTINITAEHSASSATMPTGTASTNSDFGVDLLLAMFADNGGDTATVLPGPGSPLIDRIAGTVTSTTDQRGLARTSGSAADIGAAEIQGGQIAWSAANDLAEGANGVVQLNRTGGSDPLSVRVIDVARTAERGVDYAAISQLVAWDAGETGPKTVPISALSDAVSDNGETFDLTIEASGGATVIGSGRVTVTIADVPDVPDVVPPGADRPFVKPLPPARVVDTRTAGTTVDGVNQGEGRRASDASIEIDLAGRASVPTDARAVVLNLTAIRPDTIGFVTLYPCGDRPLASSLNFAAGSIVGNEVITGLSAKGTTCIYTSAGTDITVDVVGFVPASSPVAQVTPARLLESRANQKTIDGVAEAVGRFDANGVYRLQVSGRAGIPDGAAAAILNVTAVGPAGVGFVSVHPCLDPVPLASSLNYVAGANRGNEIIAQLSNAGEVCFFTSEATHLTVDVVGWIPDAADYAAVAPARLVETREGQATVDGTLAGEGRRPAGSVLTVPVTGRAGVPAGATAAVINLTAINAAGTGFFTVWNCEGERPLASSLNYSAGVNGGNEVVAGLNSAGELCVYTFGDTHMSIDIVGYTS